MAAALQRLLIDAEYETFNTLAHDKAVHNLRDVRGCDAPVKKVIGFD
jgi:hypothetical protein